MKTAIWFSRHQPTADQVADAERLGYTITAIDPGNTLGAMELKDNGDVKSVVSGVLSLVAEHKAQAIFGVPAAPMLAQFARTVADAVQRGALTAPDGQENGDVPFFAAWNVQRSTEGGKPTFAHREWVLAGHLSQASSRWL